MNTVYIFNSNFDYQEEKYADNTEAMNRAKSQSFKNFSILENHNGKVFFFEHGETTSVKRKQELAKASEDVLIGKQAKEFRGLGGKRYSKKQ